MKIGHDRLGGAATPVEGPGESGPRHAARAKGAGTPAASDQFTASADMRVLQSAIDQAASGPDVRADVVSRMKGLLDRGELGQDAGKLADAIIDRWMTP